MSKKNLAVILGAGSLIDLEYPCSNRITNDFLNNTITRKLKNTLSKIDKNININFEGLFHLTKTLHEIAFDCGLHWKENPFYGELQTQLTTIRDSIRNAETKVESEIKSDQFWYTKFWKELASRFNLKIISTNYDALFEDVIFRDKIYDGFYDGTSPTFKEFSSEKFKQRVNDNESNTIMRLHGSVKFRNNFELGVLVGPLIGTKYYKDYNIYQCDKNTIISDSFPGSQPASDNSFATINKTFLTSIITGYDKTESMKVEPFRTYYESLGNILKNSENILIVGYNFNENDNHLNEILFEKEYVRKIIIDKGDCDEISEKSKKVKGQEYIYSNGFRQSVIDNSSEIVNQLHGG